MKNNKIKQSNKLQTFKIHKISYYKQHKIPTNKHKN